MKQFIATLMLGAAMLLSACSTQLTHNLYRGTPEQAVSFKSFPTILIKSIDNVDTGFGFIGQAQQYTLSPGQHTLIFEYADLWDISADEHDKIVSPRVKLVFTAEAGKTYQIQHAKMDNVEQSRAFARQPEFRLVQLGEAGNTVATLSSALFEVSQPRNLLSLIKFESEPDFAFASDVPKERKVMKEVQVGAGDGAETVTQPGKVISNQQPASPVSDLPHLNMLKFSWQQASEAERNLFLQWLDR